MASKNQAANQKGGTPCTTERLQLFRGLLQREHDLLIQRTNVFLLVHTIFMAGAVVGSNGPKAMPLLMPVLGMIASAIWAYMGYRNVRAENYFSKKVHTCEESLYGKDVDGENAEDKVFTNFYNSRKGWFRVLSSSHWFAYILPSLWLIAWFVVSRCG